MEKISASLGSNALRDNRRSLALPSADVGSVLRGNVRQRFNLGTCRSHQPRPADREVRQLGAAPMIRKPCAAVRRLLLTPQVIHPEVELSRRRLIRDTDRGRKHLPLGDLHGLHVGGPRVLAHRNAAIEDPLECWAEGSQMVIAHQKSTRVLNVDQVLNRRPGPFISPSRFSRYAAPRTK